MPVPSSRGIPPGRPHGPSRRRESRWEWIVIDPILLSVLGVLSVAAAAVSVSIWEVEGRILFSVLVATLVRLLHPTPDPSEAEQAEERHRLEDYLERFALRRLMQRLAAGTSAGPHLAPEGHGTPASPAGPAAPADPPTPTPPTERLLRLHDERDALVQAREDGTFDSDILTEQLDLVDSEELLLRTRERAGV